MHIETILHNEPELAKKAMALRNNPDGMFPVLSAKFKLTWKCNLKCAMCNLWRESKTKGSRHNTLAADTVKHTLSDLKAMGLRKVHFSGGEILLLPWFREIVAHATTLGLQINMTTNGTLISKELARFIIDIRIHTITVSIDSGHAGTHDKIRGLKGAFKSSWNGITLLQKRKEKKGRGPKIAVNTVVNRGTIGSMGTLYHLLCDRGIDAWRILPIDTEIKRLRPKKSQWEALLSAIETWQPILTRPPLDWSSDRSGARAEDGKYAGVFYGDNICFAPWFNVFIDADGRVYPCCNGKQDMKPFGNIRDSDIVTIMNGRTRREVCCSMATGHPFPVCDQCDDFLEENQTFNSLYTKG